MKLPSGEPVTDDEVAGLGWINLGPHDPFRKPAVRHDRMYERLRNGTTSLSQEEIDKMFLKQMLAVARSRQGVIRAYCRYGVVRLVGAFRKVRPTGCLKRRRRRND